MTIAQDTSNVWKAVRDNLEDLSPFFGVLELVIVLGGLFYAGRQLRLARKSLAHTEQVHLNNLAWNKKIAAQNALAEVKNATSLEALNIHFHYSDRNLEALGPIPLAEITEALDKDETLKQDLYGLLNFFERLSLGVNQDMYDEDVIKGGRRTSMMKAVGSFWEFIEHRRTTQGSSKAWSELEILVRKWGLELD